MNKLAAFVGTTVGGAVGWWIGARFGFMAGMLLSIVGTAAGLWYGRKLVQDFLEG